MLRQSLSILKQLGSAGKSNDAAELLHEDLIRVDQRVEPAKKTAQVLHKKLLSCMQSQTGVEAERRMKKLPLMQLSMGMAECLKDFDAESPIRRVLEMCCFMEKRLAMTLAEFEMKVEKDILEPLNKLSEEDLPEILKNKQHFVKQTRDWNNARIRSQTSTGAQAKQEGLREEVEEAWRKLENIKDQYSADLYHFATKEEDYANYFIRLLELQAEYYRNSFEFLDKNISELKENHSQSGSSPPFASKQRVYGEPLLSHLTQSQREIAVPIQECIHMLLRTGMKEEGLFRLAAAASVVKRLKTCLDQGKVDHSEFSMDPHAVAGALKSYLRELPEPLMTFELYKDWFKAAGEKELTEKLKQFRELLKKIPPENYNNLRYLVQFLSLLSEEQVVNKMTPSNIAIVLGPNLLWPLAEGEAALFDMASASSVQVVTVIEPLIQYCSELFPEAVSFEIPDIPECPEVSIPAPSLISEKEQLSRTFSSSSSTASSCSSYHTPLSKTNSTASQDSMSYFLTKSGSVSRNGTSTWAGPTSETAATSSSSSQSPSPALTSIASSSSSSTSGHTPPHPVLRPVAPNSGQQQSSEQAPLEPILEALPDSPRAFVKITSPYKPKRSFISKTTQQNDQLVAQFSKSKAPAGPRIKAPAPPATTPDSPIQNSRTQPAPLRRAPQTNLNRPPQKKPGLKAPKCPPPLPPPTQTNLI